MSESSTIDERYFTWLYSHVASPSNRDPAESHWLLCERLFKTAFFSSIRNDENREIEGRDLRDEYLQESGDTADFNWMELESSVLEMMIALARRASFQTMLTVDQWFWLMADNLHIGKYNDNVYHDAIDLAISRVLDVVLTRSYEASGLGGFFPLRDPERDQREVELWYQLSAYLLENIDY